MKTLIIAIVLVAAGIKMGFSFFDSAVEQASNSHVGQQIEERKALIESL